MSDTSESSGTDAVQYDCECRKCSYNLRTLNRSGVCPECGTPIRLSIHGNILRYSDPAWVWTLRRGVVLSFWGTFLIWANFAGAILAAILFDRGSENIHSAVLLIAFLTIAAGSWKLTTPDPSCMEKHRMLVAQLAVRAAAITSILALIDFFVLTTWNVLSAVPLVVVALAVVAVFIAQGLYLPLLVNRIPDQELSRYARLVAILHVLAPGCLLHPILLFGLPVIQICTLVMWSKISRRLEIEAAAALAIWSQELGGKPRDDALPSPPVQSE